MRAGDEAQRECVTEETAGDRGGWHGGTKNGGRAVGVTWKRPASRALPGAKGSDCLWTVDSPRACFSATLRISRRTQRDDRNCTARQPGAVSVPAWTRPAGPKPGRLALPVGAVGGRCPHIPLERRRLVQEPEFGEQLGFLAQAVQIHGADRFTPRRVACDEPVFPHRAIGIGEELRRELVVALEDERVCGLRVT